MIRTKYLFSGYLLLLSMLLAQCSKTDSRDENKIIVSEQDGHCRVQFQATKANRTIDFAPCGVNQLFAIAGGRYFENKQNQQQDGASDEFVSCTDWIGPYFVCSEENIKAGLPQKFTGGWHGSNGDGTGNPTARTSSVEITADGKPLKDNEQRSCQQVDIYVSNLIHGYDYNLSPNDLLQETVHYCLSTDTGIKVTVNIEALNDLRIQRYYGLQSQNLAIFDSVSYMAGDKMVNTEAIAADTRCRLNAGVNAYVLKGADAQHRLRVELDTTRGLGNFQYVADGLPRAFSASYRKSYFNLVNGKELIMKKGDSVSWTGSYSWQ